MGVGIEEVTDKSRDYCTLWTRPVPASAPDQSSTAD